MLNMFKDDSDKISTMRIMSFIALLTSIVLAVLSFWFNGDPIHVLYFLTAAFAPKAIQKFAERK